MVSPTVQILTHFILFFSLAHFVDSNFARIAQKREAITQMTKHKSCCHWLKCTQCVVEDGGTATLHGSFSIPTNHRQYNNEIEHQLSQNNGPGRARARAQSLSPSPQCSAPQTLLTTLSATPDTHNMSNNKKMKQKR